MQIRSTNLRSLGQRICDLLAHIIVLNVQTFYSFFVSTFKLLSTHCHIHGTAFSDFLCISHFLELVFYRDPGIEQNLKPDFLTERRTYVEVL